MLGDVGTDDNDLNCHMINSQWEWNGSIPRTQSLHRSS